MSPPPIDAWLIDLKRDGAAFARLADRGDALSPADRRRIQSYREPIDAIAFAASRAGLRQVLEQMGGATGAHLHRTRSGKPYMPGLPAISISHTRTHVAIAANLLGGIGIDIEAIRPLAAPRLVGRVAALLSDGWPPEQLGIAAWTVVEAWTKLHGLTLAEVLDSPGRGRELEAAIEAKASEFCLRPLGLPAGLVGACWTTGPVAPVLLRDLRPDRVTEGPHAAVADEASAAPQ